jgi:proteasome activator subunit 4
MLEYGDSRDRQVWFQSELYHLTILFVSHYLQSEGYASELSDARQYSGQKVWPRAVFIRRAR